MGTSTRCMAYRLISLITALCFFYLLGASHASAQSNLPPAVQADLLRDQIYAEAKANDSEAVLRSIDQYKKLGVEFPTPLLWIEAKAAHDSGDAQRALRALGDFLAKTDRGTEQHKEALALYPQYLKSSEAYSQQQTDALRASLAALVPKVIDEMRDGLVSIPGGHLSIRDHYGSINALFPWSKDQELDLQTFRILRTCITERWWDIYLADTAQSSWDNYEGGDPARCILHRGRTDEHELLFRSADLQAFMSWVNSRSRQRWRLPTEGELALIAVREAAKRDSTGVSIVRSGGWEDGVDARRQPEVVIDCYQTELISGSGRTLLQEKTLESQCALAALHIMEFAPATEFRGMFVKGADRAVVARRLNYSDDEWLKYQFRLVLGP